MGSIQLWSAAALSSDIAPGSVVPGSLPFGPIAIWRGHSGGITANHDRCPHRGMRLSHGFVRGDTLSCIYHGWSFGQNGRCSRIPAHPDLDPPETITCGPLASVEASGLVWVSAEQTDVAPPGQDGYEALRWLELSCDRPAFITRVARSDDWIPLRLADVDTWIRASEAATRRLRLFLLVPEDLDVDQRIAVSRAFEQARQVWENAQ